MHVIPFLAITAECSSGASCHRYHSRAVWERADCVFIWIPQARRAVCLLNDVKMSVYAAESLVWTATCIVILECIRYYR